ncbi:MauE/DoxX family redox-associated membrane protein [Streptomyces sp. NBC_01304]|uniref:MauE/DoxX family redox-associated membrane protein n=1 Tax=Streptomyces sp. NBC_01304 TaxID=2903818 RepID=UPI002E0D53EA|nr:hypothetical protein OG430_18815 [Streptomyces sp. NBC_01304]
MYYLCLAIRLLLIGVFSVATWGKLRHRSAFREFVRSVAGLRLFPAGLSTAIAVSVIAAEAGSVVLLAIPAAPAVTGVGFALAGCVLAAFGAGILASRRGGARVACRCFGTKGVVLGKPHIIRNLLLAALAAVGLLAVLTGTTPSSLHPGGTAIAALAAGVGGLLVVRLDDLLALIAPTADPRTGSPTADRSFR